MITGKVERRVEAIQWRGKAARAVITKRIYATGVDDLWDAMVSPDRLNRWFGVVSGEFSEGGHYQIEDNAHGTIEKCEPPNLLSITWEFNDGIGLVNASLKEVEDSAAELTLEHIAHDDQDYLSFWKQFGPGALGVGWDLSLEGLSEYLLTGGVPKCRDESTWSKTEEGETFIKLSSDAWVDAAIAFGSSAIDARVAGRRTYNFFTDNED